MKLSHYTHLFSIKVGFPIRKFSFLPYLLFTSLFVLQATPTIGATISLETLSRLKDSSGNDLNNGLVLVGSFLDRGSDRPDSGNNAISTLFTGNLTTTRANLTSGDYFTIFGEGSVLQGGVQFVGRDYTTTPITTPTDSFVNFVRDISDDPVAIGLANKSAFLLIFNQATIATSSEMMIFRPYYNSAETSRRTIPEGSLDDLVFELNAAPDPDAAVLPAELFFGTWNDDGPRDSDGKLGVFNTVGMNQVFGITSSSTASATNGTLFTYQIVANNGPISYAATGMPDGLQIDTITGLISGVPNDDAGSYTILLQSIGGTVTRTQTLTLTLSAAVGNPPIIVTTTNVVNLFAGVLYSNAYSIVASNAPGNPPITSYGASNLPAGLSVNTNTGVISGMPTQLVTNQVFGISAYNGATGNGVFNLTINAPTVTYPTLTFTAGSYSNSPVPTLTSGYQPNNFTAPNLPTGLSINSNGVIQGTPTIGGTISTSTITAANASGVASSVNEVITVNTLRPTINSAPVYTIFKNANFDPYILTTTLTSTVVPATAFRESRGALPTGLELNRTSGVISRNTNEIQKGITTIVFKANNSASAAPGAGEGPEFTLTIRVDLNPPVFTETLKRNCAAGFPLSVKNNKLLTANDPETVALSGAPSWLSIAKDGEDVKISCTPPTAGTWTIPVTIANTSLAGLRQATTQNLTITAVSSVATAASLGVRPGTFFLNQSLAVTYPPAGFFVAGKDMGADSVTSVNILGLPPGVRFATYDDRRRGLLTGTPTAKGTYPCTVYVTNPKGFTRSTMTFVVK
jgi:hypothetical protein